MDFLSEDKNGVLIRCHAQPGSSKTEISGAYGDRIKIRLQAPPIEGKANKELVKFLAKTLKVPKSSLILLRGETSRQKDILCNAIDLETAKDILK